MSKKFVIKEWQEKYLTEKISFILGPWPDGDPHKPYKKDFEIEFNPDDTKVKKYLDKIWRILAKHNVDAKQDKNTVSKYYGDKLLIKKPTASVLEAIFDILPPRGIVDAMGWS